MNSVNQNNSIFENETDENAIELINTIPPQDIFAFNELRSCADLKRMHDKNQLDLTPDFQRKEVWKMAEKTRFLDSLLKNLPIPSMCINQDINTNKRIVIDGLQRISTIVAFLKACENQDKEFKLTKLEDIDQRLSGKTAKEICEQHPEIIEFIENVTIPVTVLRSDSSKTGHMEYIFTIFHRLNTGGTRLSAQEIRNCIFSGNFNQLLSESAEKFENELSVLFGKGNNRLKHEEFLLRFFAFSERFDKYQEPLTVFLNSYMKEKRNLDNAELLQKQELIEQVLLIFSKYLVNIVDKDISKTIGEAILYGIGKNIHTIQDKDELFFKKAYQDMLSGGAFREENVRFSTTRIAKLQERFQASEQAFSGR